MTIHKGAALYRTNDGRIVAEGDPDAAFLVVAEGCQVPAEHAADIKAYADTQAERRAPLDTATMKRGGPQENK